jgi:hypothetical protein
MRDAGKKDKPWSLCIARLTYLAEIELRVLLGADTFDLNEGGVRASVTLSTLVSENTAFAVEASRT